MDVGRGRTPREGLAAAGRRQEIHTPPLSPPAFRSPVNPDMTRTQPKAKEPGSQPYGSSKSAFQRTGETEKKGDIQHPFPPARPTCSHLVERYVFQNTIQLTL